MFSYLHENSLFSIVCCPYLARNWWKNYDHAVASNFFTIIFDVEWDEIVSSNIQDFWLTRFHTINTNSSFDYSTIIKLYDTLLQQYYEYFLRMTEPIQTHKRYSPAFVNVQCGKQNSTLLTVHLYAWTNQYGRVFCTCDAHLVDRKELIIGGDI